MGAGASKPEDATRQVFTSQNPVQFSQDLIDSLQASSETDSTRAKSLDLHIQQRVAAELERIRKEESSKLEALKQKISSSPDSDSSSSTSNSSSNSSLTSPLSNLPSPKDLIPGNKSSSDDKQKQQSSKHVQEEIDKLKKQLGERKTLKELPKEVTQAREGVIACLRMNDRQPLDCWREVEIFKREVRKLEEKFVGEVL